LGDKCSEKLLISEGEFKSGVFKLLRNGFVKEIITDKDKIIIKPKFKGSLRKINLDINEEIS
jgi:hypothetical protein